jgi:hypothetical protein
MEGLGCAGGGRPRESAYSKAQCEPALAQSVEATKLGDRPYLAISVNTDDIKAAFVRAAEGDAAVGLTQAGKAAGKVRVLLPLPGSRTAAHPPQAS